MKKNIIIAAIAAVSALLLSVSCQKDEMRESGNGVNGTFTGTIEQGPTKTTLTSENKVNWESGDKISINGKAYTATPDGTDATKATFTADDGEATPDGGKYKAVYPSNLYVTDHFELPATQTYTADKFNMPMYAESSTTSLAFKNICAVLAITVNGADFTSVSSIEVSSNKQMNGEFTATDAGALTFESVTLTDDYKKVTLSISPAKAIGTTASATFYIPVPAATHKPLTIKVSDGTTTKTMVTKKSGGVTVERSKIYSIDFADNLGALSGVFSVSATKKVRFSPGNLYWDGDSFEFEANQYSFESSWSTSHISHFHWSKTASVAYAEDYSDGEASNSDVFFTNAETEIAKSGFTVSGVTGEYRTLSTAEWQYLFNTTARMVNGKPCYSNAVSGIDIGGTTYKGVFLYPDNYNGEVVSSSMSWDAIKTAGIVFLPAAGDRYGSDVYSVGSYGLYWSSSAKGSDSAYLVTFSSSSVSPDEPSLRYNGYSVRLVTESN